MESVSGYSASGQRWLQSARMGIPSTHFHPPISIHPFPSTHFHPSISIHPFRSSSTYQLCPCGVHVHTLHAVCMPHAHTRPCVYNMLYACHMRTRGHACTDMCTGVRIDICVDMYRDVYSIGGFQVCVMRRQTALCESLRLHGSSIRECRR